MRRGLLTALALATPLAAQALPSFDEVRAAHRASDTTLLSREGELLQRLRVDASVRRGRSIADLEWQRTRFRTHPRRRAGRRRARFR